jgi:hypothetical protein
MNDIIRLARAVTGDPDHQAIMAFLAPSLPGQSGSFNAPVWGGPDSGGSPTAQVFNLADGTVGRTQIAAGAVDETKFAAGIIHAKVVDALPTLPDTAYPIGSEVYLTTDGKRYTTKTGLVGSWARGCQSSTRAT